MSSPPKIEDTVPLDPNEESDEYDEDFEEEEEADAEEGDDDEYDGEEEEEEGEGDGLTALLLGDGGEEADEEEEAEEYEGQAAEKTPDIKPTPASPSKGNKRVLEAEGEENGVEQDNGAKKAKVS